jgi:hypothetical protein
MVEALSGKKISTNSTGHQRDDQKRISKILIRTFPCIAFSMSHTNTYLTCLPFRMTPLTFHRRFTSEYHLLGVRMRLVNSVRGEILHHEYVIPIVIELTPDAAGDGYPAEMFRFCHRQKRRALCWTISAERPSEDDIYTKDSGTKDLTVWVLNANGSKLRRPRVMRNLTVIHGKVVGLFVCLKRFLLCLIVISKVPSA